ncbi:uncharacterized protein LTR77_005541 [Saxophila tyrrhenica]|uniref:Calcineurin-like phosphoesterase domain-containing protein n=1 Tax=Saxophila tyrrhenica TaxID=1690608 RepID=A0AAV9PCW6_9PEZI|nr:hypothetical protein LTR77_005541 [Saxophila tyrrhenica]
MHFSRVLYLFIFTYLATAKQPSAPSAVAGPLRELPWGQLNFLHTTDTHGWHGGHLQEPQYSADWGDYISFASHLRKRADDEGSDLLLIDTGDRVEGNGLYDASDPKGNYTADIFTQQDLDVITVGNHELYKNTTSAREYADIVPAYKNSYIASNLNITSKHGDSVPFGPRYRKFTTKNQGIRVLAMGFIYNFRGNANNTQIQKVQDTVKEPWFQDAVRSKDVDLFLITGHVALRNTSEAEFDKIYDAIRRDNWDTPIAFFGGHTHIRDFKRFGRGTEKKAYGIESGRYLESYGFMSISGLSTKSNGLSTSVATPKFERLYIDNNLYSLHRHSGTNSSTFDTELGRNTSASIAAARKSLDLDKAFGCAPRDYWLYRTPYPSKDSILSLLDEHIIPDTFTDANSSDNPAIVLANSGAVRFDVFKGPFTTDTTYIVCPFTSTFRMIRNVPLDAASQVMKKLNSGPPVFLSEQEGEGAAEAMYRNWLGMRPPAPVREGVLFQVPPGDRLQGLDARIGEQRPLISDHDKPEITPGYTTTDDFGSDGDDTVHEPIPLYNPPNIVGAEIGFSSGDNEGKLPKTVDLVFNEYIQGFTLAVLRQLGVSYGPENTRQALNGMTMTDVISGWVSKNWECEENE